MAAPGARQEIEIKLRLDDAATGRRLLGEAGFRLRRRRTYENNVLFDTPGHALHARGAVLRLRRYGRDAILTYKGPAAVGRHKSRLEVETAVADAATMEKLLALLGFTEVFRYEKYRAEYRRKAWRVLVTLDETPMGVFLELEGSPVWIDRTARRLGFSEVHYITDSYVKLYRASRRAGVSRVRAMIFHGKRV